MSTNRNPKGSAKDAKGKGTGGQFASKPVASQPPIHNLEVQHGVSASSEGTYCRPARMYKPRVSQPAFDLDGLDDLMPYGHDPNIPDPNESFYYGMHCSIRTFTNFGRNPQLSFWLMNSDDRPYQRLDRRFLNARKLKDTDKLEVYFGKDDRYVRGWHEHPFFEERPIDSLPCLKMINADFDEAELRIFDGLPSTENNLRRIYRAVIEWWPNKSKEIRGVKDEQCTPFNDDIVEQYAAKAWERGREIIKTGSDLFGKQEDMNVYRHNAEGRWLINEWGKLLSLCRDEEYNSKLKNTINPVVIMSDMFKVIEETYRKDPTLLACNREHYIGDMDFCDWVNDIGVWVTDWASRDPSVNYGGALYSFLKDEDGREFGRMTSDRCELITSDESTQNDWKVSQHHMSQKAYYEDLYHVTHIGAEFLKFLTKHFESFPIACLKPQD